MMRRPDVFTLDYSHPIAQGLLWFPHLLRGRDDSIINLALGRERVPKYGNAGIVEHAGLYGRPAVSTPAAADGYYYESPTAVLSPPFTLSMWQYIGSTYSGIGGVCPMWRVARYNTLRIGAINAYGSPYTFRLQANAGYKTVFNEALMESSAWSARWAHIAVQFGATSQAAFFDGVQVATASSALSSYNGAPCIATDNTIGCVGFVADAMVHRRLLSPAEIALLADRADPMLGGLIVEERPVLYFDMGGEPEDITGTVSATESGSDTAAVTGQLLVSGLVSASETGADVCAVTGVVTDTAQITAAEVARVVSASARAKTVTASARQRSVRYAIS